jgi:hypothetical protein
MAFSTRSSVAQLTAFADDLPSCSSAPVPVFHIQRKLQKQLNSAWKTLKPFVNAGALSLAVFQSPQQRTAEELDASSST